jgi:uncharacterized membrane protein YhiD involved in acid resistance
MDPASLLKFDMTPAQVALSFLLSFALAFLWATVYRKSHSGIAYTRSFYMTLIMIAPTVTMIMMAIGSNVALSLGLVGALSIIRFRTVIKDTKDMAFLFLAIAIGLTTGANTWLVGIVGTVAISVITIVMSKISSTNVSSSDYVLVFRSRNGEPWDQVRPETRDLISWKQLRGVTDVEQGNDFEYTYNVRLRSKASAERLVGELGNGASNGTIRQVTLIAPENHLDL